MGASSEGGTAPQCWGTVLAWQPPAKLVWSFTVKPLNGAMTTVTWTLDEVGGRHPADPAARRRRRRRRGLALRSAHGPRQGLGRVLRKAARGRRDLTVTNAAPPRREGGGALPYSLISLTSSPLEGCSPASSPFRTSNCSSGRLSTSI